MTAVPRRWFELLPFTDVAEQSVRQQMAYISGLIDMDRRHLAALVVTNYVAGHLSPPRYGYLRDAGKKLPTGGINDIIAERSLTAGAGLCGQAASLAIVLYQRLRVKARQLDIWHAEGGHTTVEVWYEGAWHWFDPTFDYHYVRDGVVLSLIDAMQGEAVCVGGTGFWAMVVREIGQGAVSGLSVTSLPEWRITLHGSKKVIACK